MALSVCCVILFYSITLRHLQTPREEPTSAVATLVQENLEVGAPAAAGPSLTHGEMLQAFSALSLFPATLEACDGIPEVHSTHCGSPSPAEQGKTMTYLAATNLIVRLLVR